MGDMMENNMLKRKFHFEKLYMQSPLKMGKVFLVQIGRTHCSDNYIVEAHPHLNWFEVTCVLDGAGRIETNGVASSVKSGDIYLSFPGDIHSVYSENSNPLKYSFLSVWSEDEELLKMLEEIMILHNDPLKRKFKDENIQMLIENCISEEILNDKFSTDMLEYSLNQILRYIIRDFLPGDKTARLNINSSQELCYQMMNYINTHIYVISGLKELSEYFGYNYGYLSGVFHKTTGQTLMEYYTVCRLKSATILIKENALNFAEIAELLNYSSVYAFSRAFKNHFGISPKAYKKQLSINETDKK